MNIRNIAVIAHVDHGKTTLIDALLKQTHIFRDNQEEMQQHQILDSNELERERGITIFAKNCAIEYQDTKINIIDTPGHADFSGEVERTLGMADGALLIIDAQEGPMPQTRFVLKKALELGLKIIVVINKIDKQFANLPRTENRIDDLFLELAKNDDQLHFPKLFAIARLGKVFAQYPDDMEAPADVKPLLNTILEFIPAPQNDASGLFKMTITSLDYNNHLGRIAIGKIHSGIVKKGDRIILTNKPTKVLAVERLMSWKGLQKVETDQASAGDIIAIAGIPEAQISTTISDPSDTASLSEISISEPTLHIKLAPNSSPFSGQEGDFCTSRQIEERLDRELESNVSLKVEKLGGAFKISGMGELHLSILLESMRREGYEMEVSKPQVVTKNIDGVLSEPVEEANIIVPAEYQSVINQEMGKRFGILVRFDQISEKEVEFVFKITSRATLGLRSVLLTATKGTVVYSSQVIGWEKIGRELQKMRRGVLIADQTGEALAYGLNIAQGRGITFVEPGTKVYEGMIVGMNAKDEDIRVNVCKGKKLTNMRSKSSDGILQLTPAIKYSLEQSLDFLEEDELLEITPKSLRLRKRYLSELARKNAERNQKLAQQMPL
ncbi:MAG: GTP-binding protein [Patescibacteria group bacterium]